MDSCIQNCFVKLLISMIYLFSRLLFSEIGGFGCLKTGGLSVDWFKGLAKAKVSINKRMGCCLAGV